MTDSAKTAMKYALRGLSGFLFVIAGIAFWFGGRAIHDFVNTERILAEIEGIAVAAMFGGLGVIAKSFADRFDESQ